VVVAPDGSLVIADFIYGHVWRVSYAPVGAMPPVATLPPAQTSSPLFVTATPSS